MNKNSQHPKKCHLIVKCKIYKPHYKYPTADCGGPIFALQKLFLTKYMLQQYDSMNCYK